MNKKEAALEILRAIERYRFTLDSGDSLIRACEAIVANFGGFKDRAEWITELRARPEPGATERVEKT